MSSDSQQHLNEDQFAECMLGGTLDPEAVSHLAACAACRAEVEAFLVSVESFNASSLHWSEAQPAASLRPLVRDRKAQSPWAVATWALAGCVAVASAVSVVAGKQQHPPLPGSAVASQADDSAAQIERDNKLMLAVYEATSAGASSPVLEYGLSVDPAANSAPRSAAHARQRSRRDDHD